MANPKEELEGRQRSDINDAEPEGRQRGNARNMAGMRQRGNARNMADMRQHGECRGRGAGREEIGRAHV